MLTLTLTPSFAQFKLDGKTGQFVSFNVFYSMANYLYTGDSTNINDESFSIYGLSLEHYKPLSESVPIYLNWGMDLTFSQYKHVDNIDFFNYKRDLTLEYLYFSMVMKANAAYAFDIPNTAVTILPYAGMYARFHIGGKSYYTYPIVNKNNTIQDTISKTPLFNKSNENPEPWNRNEFGAAVGVKVFLGDFGLGIEYGKTFTDLTKETRVSEVKINALFRFNN